MLWDVFCRVVDNHGDIGVCSRLARELAARGHRVRLAVDDASALAWMAPGGTPGVRVVGWDDTAQLEPGEVVIEAFGCNPPEPFVARMHRTPAPVWINLEYLSAERHAETHHGLPSPQLAGPGAGLGKWFYYPGFTAATGGLLREQGLQAEQAAFDRAHWLESQRIALRCGERVVSLFCYANAALPQLLRELAGSPTLLLATPGHATHQVRDALGDSMQLRELRAHPLPHLSQGDYDRLLWASDLNLVRGEDSFVRAQWAGRPFLWQIYAQDDGAHAVKLRAFLALHLRDATPELGAALHGLSEAWNGLGPWPQRLPLGDDWESHAAHWRSTLWAQPDLVTRLLGFVEEKG
jgi:uncharacterized repeat protein (TIGR03837 family)